ncbi:PREDICTED: pentatricopeptide repeat-containing protein At1g50270-like [Camelina sativa]|uniref:Pentatricopeptide repeat-containing protein At1g50270-like n=1 Tax=Camelina sativa TaxID=90675 RepID=A0ABM0YJH3_CAMSA|nr:PREDICTED: pentatricopeptide repeat-containing protein At1g50270-like [Camelina sativa]
MLVCEEMLESGVVPNEKTLSCVLSACAHVGELHRGRRVHCYIIKNSIGVNTTVGTTLIDLYAKCGCLEEAILVFERLPDKNVYAWAAMISGLAAHGYGKDAVDLFQTMLRRHVSPNEVTFIAVLSACAHGGLVEEGQRLFMSMKERFILEPNVDHYACMVDLFGRNGFARRGKDFDREDANGANKCAFDDKKRLKSDDLYKTLDNFRVQMRLSDELEDLTAQS